MEADRSHCRELRIKNVITIRREENREQSAIKHDPINGIHDYKLALRFKAHVDDKFRQSL